MKRIVSLWLPAWPITRLKRVMPAAVPADVPFVLVDLAKRGIVITAVNAVAARAGLEIGMALTDARALVPDLRARPAERVADTTALFKLIRWAGRYGPYRNTDGDDSLWVDVTGVAHLYGGEDAMLEDLIRRLAAFGIPARVGLADTLGCAHALARFVASAERPWVLAPANASREVLANLPVAGLRLDAAAVVLLRRLGLRTIGQLYALPRESLARRFRSEDVAGVVLIRLDQALAVTAEPLRSLYTPPPCAVQRNFSEPLISSEAIENITGELCAELAAQLTERGLGARYISLLLYRADGTVGEVKAGMRSPCRDGRHMMGLLKEKLMAVDAGFGIDGLLLAAVNTDPLQSTQTGFAESEALESYDPGPLIDRLSNRLGAHAVTRLAAQSSHIPERAEVRVAGIRPSGDTERKRSLTASKYEPPWPYGKGPRRPPFVLTRPEPIAVVAEVPDGPPARFTWRRVERRIARAEGPERIAPEWWRHLRTKDTPTQNPARPRDYFTIEDEQGAAYWVFRHGLYGGGDEDGCDDGHDDGPRWFLHGLFA